MKSTAYLKLALASFGAFHSLLITYFIVNMSDPIDPKGNVCVEGKAEDLKASAPLIAESISDSAQLSKREDLVDVVFGPQHFDLIKLIGEGAFGKVILVRNKFTQSLYAMKVISKKMLKKKNNIQVSLCILNQSNVLL